MPVSPCFWLLKRTVHTKPKPKPKALPPQHQNRANQGLKNSLELPPISKTLAVQKIWNINYLK